MSTYFTSIYDRFLGKITDDMYMELNPYDTLKDLERLLTDSIPGFEFPRKNLYNYVINVKYVNYDELDENDFIVGYIWEQLVDNKIQEIEPNDRVPLEQLFDFETYNNWDEETMGPPPRVLIDKSYFEEELTSEEIEILAILMMNAWLQRQITSVENVRMKYSGSDFKMTSQANHLSKLQSLLSECQRQSHHLQRLYKRRAISNKTGIYESTWDWFGKHGTTNIR